MGQNRCRILPLIPIVACGLLLGVVRAQEDEEQMQAMMQAAQPNEHHEHLQKMVGSWKAHDRFWMPPGAPPTESDGMAKVSSILGGRFIQTDFSGNFMGMEFAGMGMDGYDNNKNKHIGVWVDNMGTMMMTYEGGCSDNGKVTTSISEFDDPATGQHMKMKGVTTLVSDDKFTYEAYMVTPDGSEAKTMEIVYTRQ